MATQGFVIVGGGFAAAKAAESLREQGYNGSIVIVGDETLRPYERPPLSKEVLLGKAEMDSVFVHPQEWYAEHNVELRLGVAVSGIDREGHNVQLADGTEVGYDKLLLATGASPRLLPVPGADANGVHYLRRVSDSEALKSTFAGISRLVVIGAGWIGLEVTAAAREAGVAVTVVETADLPLLRVLGHEVAEVYANLHREHEVGFRFHEQVSEITTDAAGVTGVKLADGTELPADAVVVAVGAAPNTQLAEQAGLPTDDGVTVDASLRTSDPDIYAAGDVANAFHPLLKKQIRVEHWANAMNQPATAAKAMLGNDASYDELPYFFTDQYDLGMEYLGYVEPDGYDQVVFRGDVPGREFIAFWLKENRVLAGMNVNIWDVGDPIKALILGGKQIDPQALADPEKPLEDFA